MSRRQSLIIALALVLAACGNPGVGKPASGGTPTPEDADTPDAPLDRDYPLLAERAVKLYEDVGRAFRDAGEDCPTATALLRELTATYRDVVDANAKVLHEGRARELKKALAMHGDQLDAAAKGILTSPLLSRCVRDTAFTTAFDELVGAPP